MRAFEIHRNGEKLYVAGIGENGVLTAIVCFAAGKGSIDLHLQVGGLVSRSAEHVTWIRQRPLQVGDKIQVKIVETDFVDPPKTRVRIDPAKDVQAQKDYVRAAAKQLGWKIQVSPRKSSSRKKH